MSAAVRLPLRCAADTESGRTVGGEEGRSLFSAAYSRKTGDSLARNEQLLADVRLVAMTPFMGPVSLAHTLQLAEERRAHVFGLRRVHLVIRLHPPLDPLRPLRQWL